MPANKPALDPQYEIIDPAFVADHDHWDDSEPTNIQELDRELAQQSSTELAKVAVRQSRRRALLRVCALLVPVAVSFAILQFSWRQRYWRDSNDNPVAISENLAVLQIAAKAHEVCIGSRSPISSCIISGSGYPLLAAFLSAFSYPPIKSLLGASRYHWGSSIRSERRCATKISTGSSYGLPSFSFLQPW